MTPNNIIILLCLALAGCARVAPALPSATSLLAVPQEVRPGMGSYKSLYSFGRKANDGNEPVASLVAVGSQLFGTTEYGGTTTRQCDVGCGTVFSVSTAGAQSATYRFKGGSGGAYPAAELAPFNGSLYGTTSGGGSSQCSDGCGTVFVVSGDGKSEKVLYQFKGGTDGAKPFAGLVALGGRLFGTTLLGGKSTKGCFKGCGTIFSLTSGGAENVIYRFTGGADGALPAARLTAIRGTLYGTTQYGGATTALCATGCGTVFRATPDGKEKALYKFRYTTTIADAAFPAAGVVAMDGDLYGTSVGGGSAGDGTVFSVNESSGTEQVVHSFSCCASSSDGAYPFSRLVVVKGVLYGTTRQGGSRNNGAIFSVAASGDESVVYSFKGQPDGALPQAGLTLLTATLYGTASSGGAFSEGSIFKLLP